MSDTTPLTYLNALAISCLATGLIDEAEPAFKELAAQLPDHSAGPVGLASSELARGNIDAACQILREHVDESNSRSGETKRILITALTSANRLDQADQLHQSLMHLEAANDDSEYVRATHHFFRTGHPADLGDSA
jgi:thioredoxin-like negative regulator of GroEL